MVGRFLFDVVADFITSSASSASNIIAPTPGVGIAIYPYGPSGGSVALTIGIRLIRVLWKIGRVYMVLTFCFPSLNCRKAIIKVVRETRRSKSNTACGIPF